MTTIKMSDNREEIVIETQSQETYELTTIGEPVVEVITRDVVPELTSNEQNNGLKVKKRFNPIVLTLGN